MDGTKVSEAVAKTGMRKTKSENAVRNDNTTIEMIDVLQEVGLRKVTEIANIIYNLYSGIVGRYLLHFWTYTE